MADIVISDDKTLRDINREFQTQFPYMAIMFFTPEEGNKARHEGSEVEPIDGSKTLAEARLTKPTGKDATVSIHGRTLVGNIEDNFLKNYGLYVQIVYKKDGVGYYTSDDEDKMSLTQLNKRLGEDGYEKNPFAEEA